MVVEPGRSECDDGGYERDQHHDKRRHAWLRPPGAALYLTHGRQVETELDLHHLHRIFQPLEAHPASVDVGHPIHPPGEVDDALADQHLTRSGKRAKAGCQIERSAAEAALHGHRLACVDADPKAKRQLRRRPDLVRTAPLQLHR